MRSGVFAVSQKLIQLGFGAHFTCLLVFDIFKAKGSTDLDMRGIYSSVRVSVGKQELLMPLRHLHFFPQLYQLVNLVIIVFCST